MSSSLKAKASDAASSGVRPAEGVEFRIEEVIDRCPFGYLQIVVTVFCSLVTIIDGFDAQAIGFLAVPIATSFHIDIRSFGVMFSAGLMGLMAGTLIMGLLGDRWGRRRTLIASMAAAGVFTGLTAFAHSLDELTVLRFVMGFGLGGTLPTSMSLVAEYTPARWRHFAICFAAACIPIGSMSAGLCASVILPIWGWQAMFYIGGIAPLIISVGLLVVIPESVRFLNLKQENERHVRAIMARIWPEGKRLNARFAATPPSHSSPRAPVVELFREGRASVTLLLWLTYFMNLMILYLVVSWMPAFLNAAGLPSQIGVMAITAFGFGGVIGSLVQAPLAKRLLSQRVLIAEFALFMSVTVVLALIPLTTGVAFAAAFAIGWAIQGAQAGLNAFSSTFYPTAVRSTGIGWGLGIGRLGSIVGPLLGGAALMTGWNPREIFAASAVPACFAAFSVYLSASIQSKRSRNAGDVHVLAPQH